METSAEFLDEHGWRVLLRDIHAHRVIPVIGPELVTIPQADGPALPLHQHLAPALAARLGLAPAATLNAVFCAWLLAGNSGKRIYDELRILVDELSAPPSPALLDLASITDFGLYIASTFDPLPGLALQQQRPGFSPQQHRLDFHPSAPRDLPEPLPDPYLLHIFGTHDTYPDFVVWEDDYLDYACGLLCRQDTLRLLFDRLRNRDLLFIGTPFSDWMMRLFLRIAKNKRFAEPRGASQDYIAEQPDCIPPPTIFFYQKPVGSTRIIPGDPQRFVAELTRRWREAYPSVTQANLWQRMSAEPPRDAVFISYSRDDFAAACELALQLLAAQIPVWLDRQRLEVGDNYARSLEHAVKNDASFFIALISRATEADTSRYVHQERAWAAEKHVDGYVYYLPVLIEALPEVRQEPAKLARIHREYLPGGKVDTAFTRRLQRLLEEYRSSGRPRG